MQRLLEEETNFGNSTDIMSSLATERSSIVDPFHGVGSGGQQCGRKQQYSFVNVSLLFGKSIPDKVTTTNRGPKLGPDDVDMESLAGKGKGAMTTIEGFLLEVDLRTVADEPELEKLATATATSEPPGMIESSAAA